MIAMRGPRSIQLTDWDSSYLEWFSDSCHTWSALQKKHQVHTFTHRDRNQVAHSKSVLEDQNVLSSENVAGVCWRSEGSSGETVSSTTLQGHWWLRTSHKFQSTFVFDLWHLNILNPAHQLDQVATIVWKQTIWPDDAWTPNLTPNTKHTCRPFYNKTNFNLGPQQWQFFGWQWLWEEWPFLELLKPFWCAICSVCL